MNSKRAKETIKVIPQKVYAPQAHPQQARIDEMRVIPSLVTTNPHFTPKGK
jgi:hypothetical protein